MEFYRAGFFSLQLLDFSGIIEIVIFLLTVTFRLVLLFYPVDLNDHSWSGIVGIGVGTLVFVGSVIGIVSYKDPQTIPKADYVWYFLFLHAFYLFWCVSFSQKY